jgi:hypothetical protein
MARCKCLQKEAPLQDGRQTDQHHEQLEKICQPAITHKFVDCQEQAADSRCSSGQATQDLSWVLSGSLIERGR